MTDDTNHFTGRDFVDAASIGIEPIEFVLYPNLAGGPVTVYDLHAAEHISIGKRLTATIGSRHLTIERIGASNWRAELRRSTDSVLVRVITSDTFAGMIEEVRKAVGL